MTNRQCSNCRFWDPSSTMRGEGLCRCHAPDAEKFWAATMADDWCGEHEPIEEERPDETLEGISEDDARRIGEAFGDAL